MNRSDSFEGWFQTIPPITKTFLVFALLFGGLTTFRVVSNEKFVLIWPYVLENFHVWRIFTTFLYCGSFSFNFAMHLFVLYENCRRYETNPFNTGAGGNSADFLWMLIVSMGILVLISYLFDFYILSEQILYVILYAWSRREPDTQLSIFGLRFKSLYLPWIYVAIRLLMGGSITDPLVGIAVGHAYFFCVQVFPTIYNYEVIKTPKFCVDIMRAATGLTPTTQSPIQQRVPTEPTRANDAAMSSGGSGNLRFRGQSTARPNSYNWGTGRTLGST